MPRVSTLLFLLLLACPAAFAGSASLDNARRARVMMGEETWARILRIENTHRASPYPRRVYALVFEMGGLLWFYTDADGTQSFSLHHNNLAAEKADLAPLLLEIDRGFTSHAIVPDEMGERTGKRRPLPQGCLIESYAALRERLACGEIIFQARLLTYYLRGRRIGHTVLAYESPSGLHVIDPMFPEKRMMLESAHAADPLALARKLQPHLSVEEARWVPALSKIEAPMIASLDPPRRLARERENTALQ